MSWRVEFTGRAQKAYQGLPQRFQDAVDFLVGDMQMNGPVRGDWPNYSKLGNERHHCHLNKRGRPTYVVCWEVKDKMIRLIEVCYVGTREKAPY